MAQVFKDYNPSLLREKRVKDDTAQNSGMDPGAEMATGKIHTKPVVH